MKILAISGSLRTNSFNSAIINYLALSNKDVNIYKDLDKLPFFNPDLDDSELANDVAPFLVQEFRQKIALSDVILFSTPEYVFEISGVLKNALEWLVASGVMDKKRVVVISASTSAMGANKANEHLCELLKVLTSKEVTLTLKVDRANKKIDDKGLIIDEQLKNQLNNLLKEVLI